MKKCLLLCALIALFAACDNNEPKPTKAVTFTVDAFQQSSAPMAMPKKSPIYDDTNTELTDIYVFDGTTEVAHQVSTAEDFGTIVLNLTHGTHNLSFIATRSTDISVADAAMTMGGVKSTYGKLHTLQVTNATPSQDITLDRVNGQLVITILDAFPAAANEIEFIIDPRYNTLDVTTLQAINGESITQRVSCASKVGKAEQKFTFATLAPSLSEEYTASVTINVYNASNAVIYTVTVPAVRLAANTKTLLSGKLFTAPGANVSVDNTWREDISVGF